MITILEKSVSAKPLRSFRTLTWNSTNNLSDTATKTFWQVRTPFRKFTFIEYMKMRMFFDGLPIFLQRCLFDAPGTLNDKLFVQLLIANNQVSDKEILVQRLNILQKLIGKLVWDTNTYFAISGNAQYRIEEIRQAIRQSNKYTGYVRNSSSVGSKRMTQRTNLTPETFEWTKSEEIDFLRFLTVGEFASGTPGSQYLILKMDQKSETEKSR